MFGSNFSEVAYSLAVSLSANEARRANPRTPQLDDMLRSGPCEVCGAKGHTKAYGPRVDGFPGLSGLCSRHPMWDSARNILMFYKWAESCHNNKPAF